MGRTRAFAGLLAPALLLSGPLAFAQEPVAELAQDISEGSHVNLSVEAGVTYTDNFFSQNGGCFEALPATTPPTQVCTEKRDAWGGLLQPTAGYTFAIPRFRFNTDVRAELAMFDLPSNVDDYADVVAAAGLEWQSALRHRFDYIGQLQFDHDPFGSERTEASGVQDRKLDRWRRFSGDARYHYGLPTAPFNLDLRVTAGDKEYTTNRASSPPGSGLGGGTRFLDFEKQVAALTLLYNLSPKTALLADAVGARTAFDNNPGGSRNRDGIDLHYRVGVRWLATAKTSGDVRVGVVERRGKGAASSDFTEPDWEGTLNWMPLSYTQLQFQTGRRIQESYLTNVNFLDNTYYNLEWSFDWTSRIVTRLAAGYSQTEFVGAPSPGRRDDHWHFGANGEYRATRSLSLLVAGWLFKRDSTLDRRDYDKVTAYLGARYAR
ncbi:MAG TPA: outer membrane beta-barrel protein [Solimonas sp.]|nr:outer membrane beta-barrel protein [Solimonas sp.]